MFFKRILSYIYPITIEKRHSKVSGVLEVNLEYGKLVINTTNANYSYGSLHSVFQNAIRELNFDEDEQKNVLILGFGGGSIAHILLDELNVKAQIDAVELDEEMIALYHHYYDKGDKNITIYNIDALNFLAKCTRQYDYIFVDIFEDLHVPKKLLSKSFLTSLKDISKQNAQLVMNTISIDKISFKNLWTTVFEGKTFTRVYENLNLVFFAIVKK